MLARLFKLSVGSISGPFVRQDLYGACFNPPPSAPSAGAGWAPTDANAGCQSSLPTGSSASILRWTPTFMTACLPWRRNSARCVFRCWHRGSFFFFSYGCCWWCRVGVARFSFASASRCLSAEGACAEGGGAIDHNRRPRRTAPFLFRGQGSLAFTKREEPLVASALQWPLPRVWFVLLVPCFRLTPCVGDGDQIS